MITYQYFKEFGYDAQKLRDRLRLCELDEKDKEIAEKFQGMVMVPNLERIVDRFYDYLISNKEYREFIQDGEKVKALKKTQTLYLASLGENYMDASYFDMRLRVGVAHNRIGMPLVLYETSYRKMRSLILEYIPAEINDDLKKSLAHFCERIISLDMSLAIDSYYQINVHEMKTKIFRLEDKKKRLQAAAETDPLTHIANRTGVMTSLYQSIEHSRQMGSPLALVMLDIDKLGVVNDEYGHLVGDYLIKEVTKRISNNLPAKTPFGRYGGDEFIFILQNRTEVEAAEIAKSLQRAICSEPFHVGNMEILVSLSQGVYMVSKTDELIAIFKHLDTALHNAKQRGGNCVELYEKVA